MNTLYQILLQTWHFAKESSLWLFIGFLFAGILKAFVPQNALLKYLGKKDAKSIFTATIIGIPLPLCSCGVIPTGMGLYKQGASLSATLAFLIATPATTVTTILISLGMLGVNFTIATVITCILVASITGFLASVLIEKEVKSNKQESRPIKEKKPLSFAKSLKAKLKIVFHYGFVDMVKDIGIYIVLGLFAAGIIATVFPKDLIAQYLGKGLFPLFIMVLIGAPMYICSTASIPFVAALIAKGMNPAAGLVFLIAGPATNVSTILSVWKVMGRKTAILYLSSIIILSIIIAFLFNLIGWL